MIKRRSLKLQIVLPTILMFSLLMILLIGVINFSARSTIKNFIYDDIYTKQEDMYQGMTMVLDEINLFYSRIVLSNDLQTIIEDDTLSNEQKVILFQDMMTQVGMNTELFKEVLFYFDEQSVRLNDSLNYGNIPPAFLQNVLDSNALIEFYGVEDNVDNEPYLLFAKPLSQSFSGVDQGAIFFFLDETKFRTFYDTIDDTLGYSFILSDEQYVISNSNGDFVGSQLFDAGLFTFETLPNHTEQTIDGERYIIIVNESPTFKNQYNLDWQIVSVLSYEQLYDSVIRLNSYNIVLGIVMGLVALFLSIRIAKKISMPINNIIDNLRRFTTTKQTQTGKKIYSDELVELETTYDDMINQIINLIEKNKEDAETQRKLELYTLQMQINPHFLYNTLDAIAWMAKIKKQDDIEHLVLALAKFFRMSLHKGDKYIDITDEIEIIRHFINIELIRFPNQFTVSYHIEKKIEHHKTLKLILQPIVENAIKHGISQLDRKGHISISATTKDNDIIFEIADDGVGFDTATLLNRSTNKNVPGGYGLKNVDDRLKLEYGDNYGVHVESQINKGTKVTLKIKKT